MELREVARLEVTHPHQGHRQGVTHGERRRSGACRSEIERARLMLHVHFDVHRGIFREQRVWIPAHSNDRHVHVEQDRYEPEQFIGLAGVAQGQYDVFRCHGPKVAMISVEGIDEKRRRACRGKRGRDLGTDVAALSYACHNHLAVAMIH